MFGFGNSKPKAKKYSVQVADLEMIQTTLKNAPFPHLVAQILDEAKIAVTDVKNEWKANRDILTARRIDYKAKVDELAVMDSSISRLSKMVE